MSNSPNVLFVLTDQMRAEAMGCMGNDQIRTPSIDRMADEGVLCTRNYSPDPVCTPARASILTGQYPHVHRTITNNFRLPTEATTMANALDDAGYETGYIGKWHLDGSDFPGSIPPERRQGFEYWKGFNRGHAHLKGHPHFDENGDIEWEEGYQPAVQTDMAIDYIDAHAGGDDPFFCYLSFGPPHTPYEAPEEYEDQYDAAELELRPNVPERMADQARRDLVSYYGMITSIDDQLERLLASLKENGIAEETIVVFASDHGELMGSQGSYYKGESWEESVHVPLVWRYPAELPESETRDELVSLIDLMPTILSMCGVDVPEGVQGEDLTQVLRDGDETEREKIYMEYGMGSDDQWRAVRTDEHLFAVDYDGNEQYLFNTEDDPYQQHNLVDLVHERLPLEKDLVEAAKRYDDRYFLARIDETPY